MYQYLSIYAMIILSTVCPSLINLTLDLKIEENIKQRRNTPAAEGNHEMMTVLTGWSLIRILIPIGAAVFIWCLIPVFTGRIVNIGNVTGMTAGAILLLTGIFPRWTSCLPIWLHWLIRIAVMIICALVVLESALMIRAVMRRPSDGETLIVPGCTVYGEKPSRMLYERIDVAEIFLRERPASCAVLSGGQGSDEAISEAEAMYRVLISRGIDPCRLYREARSTTTQENIRCSLEIIRHNGLNDHVAIATNEFHIYRAGRIAEKLGLSYSAVPAHTAWWLFATFYIRELYAILADWFRGTVLIV